MRGMKRRRINKLRKGIDDRNIALMVINITIGWEKEKCERVRKTGADVTVKDRITELSEFKERIKKELEVLESLEASHLSKISLDKKLREQSKKKMRCTRVC